MGVEQIITRTTAFLARGKGFGWRSGNVYSDIPGTSMLEDFHVDGIVPNNMELLKYVDERGVKHAVATSQSVLQKWLRDEKRIVVHVIPIFVEGKDTIRNYEWQIFMIDDHRFHKPFARRFDNTTWEEALEKGLQEALELI